MYICRKLFQEGSFKYAATPTHSLREIYYKSMHVTGCWPKVSTFLVCLLDIRFKGDWGKTSPQVLALMHVYACVCVCACVSVCVYTHMPSIFLLYSNYRKHSLTHC